MNQAWSLAVRSVVEELETAPRESSKFRKRLSQLQEKLSTELSASSDLGRIAQTATRLSPPSERAGVHLMTDLLSEATELTLNIVAARATEMLMADPLPSVLVSALRSTAKASMTTRQIRAHSREAFTGLVQLLDGQEIGSPLRTQVASLLVFLKPESAEFKRLLLTEDPDASGLGQDGFVREMRGVAGRQSVADDSVREDSVIRKIECHLDPDGRKVPARLWISATDLSDIRQPLLITDSFGDLLAQKTNACPPVLSVPGLRFRDVDEIWLANVRAAISLVPRIGRVMSSAEVIVKLGFVDALRILGSQYDLPVSDGLWRPQVKDVYDNLHEFSISTGANVEMFSARIPRLRYATVNGVVPWLSRNEQALKSFHTALCETARYSKGGAVGPSVRPLRFFDPKERSIHEYEVHQSHGRRLLPVP